MASVDLSGLGLSRNEAKAYETLLHLGKATAAQISKQSGVPYGRIYDVLASLEHKHLATLIPESTRKYAPTDPEALHAAIAAQKRKLDDAESKIMEFKSVYAQHEQPSVQVVTGRGTFLKVTRAMPVAQRRVYSVKYTFDPHPEFLRENRDLKRRNIAHLTLGRIDAETRKNVETFRKLNPGVKPIRNNGVAMSLVDDKAMWIVLVESNTTLVIRDKPFIDLMAELFKSYYDTH